MAPLDDDDIQLPDIRSPEHRRALRERGAPHGDHVKPDEEDDMGRPHLDRDTAVAIALADLRDEQRAARQAAAAAHPSKTPWATTPVIVGMIVGVVSIVGSAATTLQGYTQLGDRLQSFGERMLAMDGRVSNLEKDFQARGKARDQEVSSLAANNSLQDERLQNLTKALEQERQARIDAEADQRRNAADQRAIVNDMTKTLGEVRSDIKVLVDRAQRSHAEAPRAEHDAQMMPGR